MKTAGVMLDFYDDPTGSLLKSVFPTAEELPDLVKAAHILNPEERAILRDDAYALVVHDEGRVIRKFACVDPGNTLLSLLYFDKTASLLPEEARAQAGQAIYQRAVEFGLIEKDAASKGASRKRDPMRQPIVGDEADWAERTDLLQKSRSSQDNGRVGTVIPSLNTKTAGPVDTLGRAAEWAKPHVDKAVKAVKKNPGLTAGAALTGVAAGRMSKDAAAHAMQSHWEGTAVDDKLEGLHEVVEGMIGRGKMPVDVTGKDAGIQFQKKTASRYALDGHYPLDSYADIRAAVGYFKDHWTEFDPSVRHEFAMKTAAAAEEIGLELPDILARYGSTEYAPDLAAHLANRKINVDPQHHRVYDALLEKKAELEPALFAELLAKADQATGMNWHWGGAVCDPWFATFGGRSDSEKTAFGWEGGGYQVDAERLQEAAASGVLRGHFTDDVVTAFEKDPVTIFSSMPDDMKVVMARLATE
jgi:hypothetical protein